MNELTKKFRELFAFYDYRSRDIKKLTQLLDLVLSMMTIVDKEDTDKIQKLSSFVKIFSSDFSLDILDETVICLELLDDTVIDVIYENQILPIFLYFDDKYGGNEEDKEPNKVEIFYDTDSQKLRGVVSEDLNNETECKVSIDIRDEEPVYISEDEKKSYNEALNIIDISENREYGLSNKDDPELTDDYSILFDVLKSTSEELQGIWISVKSNLIKDSEDKISKMERIQSINESAKITLYHPYKEIKNISKIICGLCSLLTDIMENDVAPSQSNISTVKLLFDAIRDIKYDYFIH